MTEQEMLKCIEDRKMSWKDISCEPLSEEFIEKHFDELDKHCISAYQNLSENFIKKHLDELDEYDISKYQKLTKEFIEKHFDELNKYNISIYQNLSEKFIEKHFNKLDKERIERYQYLSPEFRKKYNLTLPYDSWMYWSREDKERYIRENTNYEIKNGKVIAYKSCRKDGYSIWNFHYHYEVGKEYTSHCDCNSDNESSFGLSAWSREGALDYHNEGKLFKVEINLDDLGCITKEGKIRSRKLRIIKKLNNRNFSQST